MAAAKRERRLSQQYFRSAIRKLTPRDSEVNKQKYGSFWN
jgi:hypothetical protein